MSSRLVLWLGLAALTIAPSRLAYAQSASPSPTPPPAFAVNDLLLQIAVRSANLSAGDAILIKVSVKNDSPHETAIIPQTPWNAVKLTIQRDGSQIFPTASFSPYYWRFGPWWKLAPGETLTFRWADPGIDNFYPISDWGFVQPFAPGRYRISATPTDIAGSREGVGQIYLPHSAASNTVDVVVTEK